MHFFALLSNRGQDLWVSNVGKSWEGIFTCMAENSLGQKSATAMVVVIGKLAVVGSIYNQVYCG